VFSSSILITILQILLTQLQEENSAVSAKISFLE
jgi:hypothetical protein